MLGSNNGIDNGGEVIDIGKRFYTKNDIVESALSTSGSIFWCSDNMARLEAFITKNRRFEGYAVLRDVLKARLPYESDVAGVGRL